MAIREISSYHLGDMMLVFEEETEFHRVGFYMIPWYMQKDRVLDRKFYRINSLAQVKIAGDMYPNCYGNGQTMRNGESANRMDYKSQKDVATEYGKEILTDDHGGAVIAEHGNILCKENAIETLARL